MRGFPRFFQHSMRILSYNIQAGINSSSYLSYSYQWHRQLLPNPGKARTLERIADFIKDYDVVCLQEVELGGLRNGFKSQREQLLEMSNFRYDLVQTNRRLSHLSLHGNLILSKTPITEVLNKPLPGKISGRGILAGAVAFADTSLVVGNLHLSLGAVDQHVQLRFIRNQLQDAAQVLLCGDFNCAAQSSALRVLSDHGYRRLGEDHPTFPSWKPRKTLDHALLKGEIYAEAHIAECLQSDHLPLQIELQPSPNPTPRNP